MDGKVYTCAFYQQFLCATKFQIDSCNPDAKRNKKKNGMALTLFLKSKICPLSGTMDDRKTRDQKTAGSTLRALCRERPDQVKSAYALKLAFPV